jgi:RNA polymerase sigma factor (sigma-70 family)
MGYKLKIRKSNSFKDVTNTMVELDSLQPKGVVPLGSKYLIEDWRIFCSDSSIRLKPNRELIVSDLKAIFLSMRTALARAASKIVLAHEVEDIVQETYVKLCLVKNSKRIKHPKSYLYKMAQNLARDHVKTATYRLSDSLEDIGDVFIDQNNEVYRLAVSSEEFTQFCETVRYLPIQCKRAFVLKKVYGYSQKEIAKELKISQSTVEKHVALGLKRCAEKMHSRESSGQLKREY